MLNLLKCCYGEEEHGETCCLVTDGQNQAYMHCPVFDWEECRFGLKVAGCGTCEHAAAMTVDDDGNRLVDCSANELQMYSPYATECKHWEKTFGKN